MSVVQVEHLGDLPSLLGVATRLRVRTQAGHSSTVHVARWPLDTCRLHVIALDPPRTVQQWCREAGVGEAINGGFFTKPRTFPLGEVVVDGRAQRSTPFRHPWAEHRGALEVLEQGGVRIAPRRQLSPRPAGSLLQAGPLLVASGAVVVAAGDPEGFQTTRAEFDSDITAEALPRVGIGLTADDELLGVAVDGRGEVDDGLLLPEFARLFLQLGAVHALNLDGGSTSSLVTAGERRNCPRDDSGTELVDGYPTATLLAITNGSAAIG